MLKTRILDQTIDLTEVLNDMQPKAAPTLPLPTDTKVSTKTINILSCFRSTDRRTVSCRHITTDDGSDF